MKTLGLIIAACLASSSCGLKANATATEPVQISPSIGGMTRAEFEDAVQVAMPQPILQLMRWRTLGRDNYAIEMSLAGIPNAPQPAMHVTFHTPLGADRALLLEAIRAAGAEARSLMVRQGMRP